MKIAYRNSKWHYYDAYGVEIHEGDYVLIDGRRELVLKAEDGELGIDATNPAWIESGRAFPGQYGIYPFCEAYDPVLVS